MGVRAGRKRSLSRRQERRTLFLVVAIVLVPALAAALAIVGSRMGPDLSDLASVKSTAEGKKILDWPALLRYHSSGLSSDPRMAAVAADCALGYMAAGEQVVRDGDFTNEFVLLPETGNLLHPAHRFGDQMIAVRLGNGRRIRFARESLTWACGSFRMSPGDPEGQRPLYALSDADAMQVGRDFIAKYFSPR